MVSLRAIRGLLAGGLAVAVLLGGCAGSNRRERRRVAVAASFYPLEFVAKRVGGSLVKVDDLTPAGAEPHDIELSPGKVRTVQTADLVLYLGGGFQPAVKKAVSSTRSRAFDVRSAIGNQLRSAEGPGAADPHFWLDPTRMASAATAVAGRLSARDRIHGASYRARADGLLRDLDTLDARFRSSLASCRRHEIVTSHAAFGYLAARYGLRQIPIAGLDPEAEPSPRRLNEVVRLVRELKVTTIFTETLASPKLAQTLAREAHVRTAVLDPVEGIRRDSRDDYLTVMKRNLVALRGALGCG